MPSSKRRRSERERVDERLSIIIPLLPYADKEDKESKETFWQMRREAASEHGLTTRTIDRYIEAYNESKTSGLEAKYPTEKKTKLEDKIIDRAIELKKELPSRSIEVIISILVQEGLAQEGEIKRTTLQDALARKGYSCKEMRRQNRSMFSSDRYEAYRRNELWVTDFKVGPKINYDGKETQTYLSAIMDDKSRHIVFAKFYTSQGAPVVVDSLKHAIEEYGVPEQVYFDNGKMYTSKMVDRFCRVLGIYNHPAPPYRPQAKGKIERFFGTMNAFMEENAADPAKTLSQLNERLGPWLEVHHEHHVNRTTQQEPEERYWTDRAPQNFVSKELIDLAARLDVKRKVDNCGDVSFENHDFHVGLSYAHQEVSLMYDDSDHTVLYMENPDGNIVEIRARVTGRYTNKNKLPEAQPVDNSTHYLDNLSKKASKKKAKKEPETLFDYCEKMSSQEGITQTINFDEEDM